MQRCLAPRTPGCSPIDRAKVLMAAQIRISRAVSRGPEAGQSGRLHLQLGLLHCGVAASVALWALRNTDTQNTGQHLQRRVQAGCCASDHGAGLSSTGGVAASGRQHVFSLQVAQAVCGAIAEAGRGPRVRDPAPGARTGSGNRGARHPKKGRVPCPPLVRGHWTSASFARASQ